MKRIIALLLVAGLMMLTLSGCGGMERLNYVKGLDKYVELCDLNSIVIDRNSADYIEVATNIMTSDLNNYTEKITEGKVEKGDTANIDYAGKVDGVAFTGGTANAQELTIGSGQFIEGFEDQLIGVKIGDTVDINVTFPADYGDSTDLETGSKTIKLSGQAAVFTVTVNHINRPYGEINDDFAAAAGYKNADEYMKELEKSADEQYLVNYLVDNSKFELPPDKDGNTYSYYKNYYTDMATYYNMTFEDFLAANSIDENTFKKQMLTTEIILYACFDALGLEIPENAVKEKAEEAAKNSGTTSEEIIKQYTENYIECIYVEEAAVEKLLEKIEIKGDSLNAEDMTAEE